MTRIHFSMVLTALLAIATGWYAFDVSNACANDPVPINPLLLPSGYTTTPTPTAADPALWAQYEQWVLDQYPDADYAFICDYIQSWYWVYPPDYSNLIDPFIIPSCPPPSTP